MALALPRGQSLPHFDVGIGPLFVGFVPKQVSAAEVKEKKVHVWSNVGERGWVQRNCRHGLEFVYRGLKYAYPGKDWKVSKKPERVELEQIWECE